MNLRSFITKIRMVFELVGGGGVAVARNFISGKFFVFKSSVAN